MSHGPTKLTTNTNSHVGDVNYTCVLLQLVRASRSRSVLQLMDVLSPVVRIVLHRGVVQCEYRVYNQWFVEVGL